MNIVQNVIPFETINGKVVSIQYVHRCPKCDICLDYGIGIWNLKYCYNCGVRLHNKGIKIIRENV